VYGDELHRLGGALEAIHPGVRPLPTFIRVSLPST
jgi:hypothetical protein